MIPAYYQLENLLTSADSPSTLHVHNTRAAAFFRRYFFQRASSVFKFKLPETWPLNYFLLVLYAYGNAAIFKTDRYGVIFSQCGFEGYNVFYQPTHCVISNPAIRYERPLQIGRDCVHVHLMPDYGSILDIIYYYADLMALCCETLETNLANSKLAYVFMAGNRANAESMKKMYDQIMRGETAVVIDKQLVKEDGTPNWQYFTQNLSANFITPDVLETMRKIQNMFDTEIGVPNANTEKKERQIVDEVNANNAETFTKCELWMQELKKQFDDAQRLFPELRGKLSVEWREIHNDGDALASGASGVQTEPV